MGARGGREVQFGYGTGPSGEVIIIGLQSEGIDYRTRAGHRPDWQEEPE